MMMEILSSALAEARPTSAAIALRQARAVAAFNNFRNVIFILPFRSQPHWRQRKTILFQMVYCARAPQEVVTWKRFIAIRDEGARLGDPRVVEHDAFAGLRILVR